MMNHSITQGEKNAETWNAKTLLSYSNYFVLRERLRLFFNPFEQTKDVPGTVLPQMIC